MIDAFFVLLPIGAVLVLVVWALSARGDRRRRRANGGDGWFGSDGDSGWGDSGGDSGGGGGGGD